MAETRLETLPEECLSHVISFTSPRDACRSSIVSGMFRDAADSDLAWENFLPSDYREIISRSVSPVEFSSKKELFRKLSSTPLLIDGGNKLIMVCWLEIRGKINTRMLSPNTTYGAYLVIQLAGRAFGLGVLPSEVSIEVGDYKTRGTIYMNHEQCKRQEVDVLSGGVERVLCARGDGWLEVELGEFYNDGSEKEVKMEFREIKGEQLKGGLVVEGIELRPKHSLNLEGFL
ncbi:hypothetical protein DH2020_003241 [Rehmannia glutinosa]|uniref:F-box domain-containing protein n=1 Tax=Rehmannia glutinosa TaxID=99300 RepID=A0ABR0XL78_REHGL